VHRSYAPGEASRAAGHGALAFDVNADDELMMVTVTSEFEPVAANRVTLDPTTLDASGRPVLRVDAHRTAANAATTAAARDALAAAGAEGEPDLTWFHPAGTCRMGATAETGVVDRDGRVFGTDNLHVCGAAVFPTSGPTNPTLTVVALALRLADHLATLVRR
jgi:choline dehydrogenase-like flavoprotein